VKWAVYNLSLNPPGFDFLLFLQRAIPEGIGGIRFHPGFGEDHGTKEDEKRKFERITLRLCNHFGLKYVFSEEPVENEVFPTKQRNAHTLQHTRLLKSPTPIVPSAEDLEKAAVARGGIVVIPRESKIQPLRNSGPDWRKWASAHDAVVLEDAEKTDMTPMEIAAYVNVAALTVGVFAGVMTVAMCSHCPYLMFKCLSDDYRANSPRRWSFMGWEVGDQLPWSGKHQKMVWNSADDYDTIEREYQAYMETNGKHLPV
jgi:hypothetical protein